MPEIFKSLQLFILNARKGTLNLKLAQALVDLLSDPRQTVANFFLRLLSEIKADHPLVALSGVLHAESLRDLLKNINRSVENYYDVYHCGAFSKPTLDFIFNNLLVSFRGDIERFVYFDETPIIGVPFMSTDYPIEDPLNVEPEKPKRERKVKETTYIPEDNRIEVFKEDYDKWYKNLHI
jgi:hypothetical protein